MMLMMALSGAEMAMRDLGVPVEAGSGVAAAQEFYRAEGNDNRQGVPRLIAAE